MTRRRQARGPTSGRRSATARIATPALLSTLLLALLSQVALAATEVRELPLPEGATNPAALAFDDEGALWIALDGSWALARLDIATSDLEIAPLAAPKSNETDTLWGLKVAPDGTVWTSSQEHVHSVDRETLAARSFALPWSSQLAGDLHVAADGGVWVALVTADRVARVDPETGEVTGQEMPEYPFGPLMFTADASGVYLTGTYADTVARFDPASGAARRLTRPVLSAPVGVAAANGSLWVAEMGESSVSRVDPATGATERYPTSSSPFYPVSGPSGILVARDGSVWFAEHFADRIARLDPRAGTLHEFQVPSAPGTNVQRVAEAPDGAIWFAEWSPSKLGNVRFGNEAVPIAAPGRIQVASGASVRVPLTIPASAEFGAEDVNLTLRYENGEVVVDATKAAPGQYRVLLASRDGATTVGRYATVDVVEAARTPTPGVVWVLVGLVVGALAVMRRARR